MLKPHYRIEMKNSDYTCATYVYKQKKNYTKQRKTAQTPLSLTLCELKLLMSANCKLRWQEKSEFKYLDRAMLNGHASVLLFAHNPHKYSKTTTTTEKSYSTNKQMCVSFQ